MYRDQALARETQVVALRDQLDDLQAELDRTRRAREEAVVALERIRDGVHVDPALESEPSYRRLLMDMRVLAAIAAIVIAASLVPLTSELVAPPRFDLRGLQNFAYHLQHGRGLVGIAAAGFVVVLASPWVIVPLLSARGLARHRRAGWTLAVIACVIFLPTPLFPAAALGMVELFSRRIRKAYCS